MTETRITLAKLIENTSIPESLVRAVVRQSGGWSSFKESAPDIANHGIDGGFHGFIYTADTQAFARRNRKAIAQMAQDQASDFGMGIMDMVRGFGTFRHDKNKPSDAEIGSALYGGKNAENGPDILNVMAWYAGEEVARAYVNLTE